MVKTFKYISIIAAIICWISAIYTFWQAYSKDNLISLAPIIAYNSPQGIFGWSISLAIILTGASWALIIVDRASK
ncbi:hypothetical protein [Fructilactobacillus frigidiflavus]|uniref:hypothetical protein n=1 Tax=Fructilactobacillus frigidiflavus TaxID=3242688 RepID=UPI003756A469